MLDEPTNLPEGAEVRLLAADGDDLDEQDRKELHAAIEAGERKLDLGRRVAEDEAISRAGDASDPPHDWADYMRYRSRKAARHSRAARLFRLNPTR